MSRGGGGGEEWYWDVEGFNRRWFNRYVSWQMRPPQIGHARPRKLKRKLLSMLLACRVKRIDGEKIMLERRKGTLQALTRVDKLNRSQVKPSRSTIFSRSCRILILIFDEFYHWIFASLKGRKRFNYYFENFSDKWKFYGNNSFV